MILTKEFIATTPAAYLVQSPVDLTPLPTFSTEVTIEEVVSN